MEGIKKEFEALAEEEGRFLENFENSTNCLARKACLLHTLQYLIHVKSAVDELPEGRSLSSDHLREIRPEDSSVYISKLMSQKFEELLEEKEGGLDEDDLLGLIYSTFKPDFMQALGLFAVDGVCRLVFSVLILYLFEAVGAGDLGTAYVFTAVLIVFWYLSQLFKQTACVITYVMVSRIKAGLAMLLYAKISQMTSAAIRSSPDLGKITNLLANDLGTIEQQITNLTTSLSFPLMVVGFTAILIARIGWAGIVGILIVVLLIPVSNCISRRNGDILKEINRHKDRRVQFTTETIEGIKYVKLYGWELAFTKIIQGIRELELAALKRLALGRSVERGLGNSISLLSSLLMLIIASNFTADLTFAKIFSILEIMASLKVNVLLLVLGIGLYYEIKVVLARFASIFNLELKSMI
jgi:ABC-type multidrug transport system fused ATPase/permease subunit